MTATTPRVERVSATVRWLTPGPQPNGMQAVPEGVWVIDQKDLNVYLLDWNDGHTLHQFPTQTNHSSGLTWDGEHLWVASTFPPIELFAFTRDGREVRRLVTPGASEKSGAHGLEWIENTLWVTVPPAATTYQIDPRDGRILRQFDAPGSRPHGIAWDGNLLWVAETSKRTITGYTLDGEARRVLEMEEGPAEGPAPHGMTYKDGEPRGSTGTRGELWYCDADTRAVCVIEIPEAPED